MDIELWFIPTYDSPELARTVKLTRLCNSITPFYSGMIKDEASTSRKKFTQSLSTSDVVHVFRLHHMVSAINHNLMVWDIDELPWLASRQTSTDRQQYLSDLYSNCFRKCRRVFASSHLERQRAHFDGIAVIPNVAVDPELGNFESSEKAPILVFVGNLNLSANIDGLNFFNDFIVPDLARNIPNVLVSVIGRSPVTEGTWAAVNQLRNAGRFEFVFDVPLCTPYYFQAAASIAPIHFGGGTRIKIIESFAHHCPVISTKKGCEGLEVEHRKHLLVEDNPRDFALACVELIQSPKLRNQMAEAAFDFFQFNHSQKVVDTLLLSVFQNLS